MPKATRRKTSIRAGATVERPRRSTRQSTPKPIEKPPPSRRKPKTPSLPLYTRTQNEVAADPNRNVGLLRLPGELLKDIARDHLPLESAICLTLTCKEALSNIGSWPWLSFKALHRWDATRKNLFELLLRVWGSDVWTFCGGCNTMHPSLKIPREHRKTALTTYCFGQAACVDYLPKMEGGKGYSLVWQHIEDTMRASVEYAGKEEEGPTIDMLAGDYTVEHAKFSYGLASSARRLNGYLVLEHVHTFQGSKNGGLLCAKDVVNLPVRLCPHQSTTTSGPKEKSMYIKSVEANSPQLTHAITTAFPATAQRAGVKTDTFKEPSPLELKDMNAADAGEAVLWKCRSCPTKYRVEYLPTGRRLVIRSWHCFGRDLLHASKYWKWFVRREGKLLGSDKRNDEWWSIGRSVPDFAIE
jgi:hypothetical protein